MAVGRVPNQVSTPSLSDGCTTATFSWTAPLNGGLSITKYGWQFSTNGGSTWSSETETTSTSASIDVNNNTNSYVVRVRAFNSLGWGPYSSQSAGSTAWVYEPYTDSASCTSGSNCDSCGTQSGIMYRTCYRYVRPNCNTTNLLNCGGYGGCNVSGGCSGSWVEYSTSGTYDGISYTAFTDYLFGITYLRRTNDGTGGCGCDSYYAWAVYQCSVTGAWRHIAIGCVQWTPGCGGS